MTGRRGGGKLRDRQGLGPGFRATDSGPVLAANDMVGAGDARAGPPVLVMNIGPRLRFSPEGRLERLPRDVRVGQGVVDAGDVPVDAEQFVDGVRRAPHRVLDREHHVLWDFGVLAEKGEVPMGIGLLDLSGEDPVIIHAIPGCHPRGAPHL